jgi:hypothetical protein
LSQRGLNKQRLLLTLYINASSKASFKQAHLYSSQILLQYHQLPYNESETTAALNTHRSEESLYPDDEHEFSDSGTRGSEADESVEAPDEEAFIVDPFVDVRIAFVSTKSDLKYEGVIEKSGSCTS